MEQEIQVSHEEKEILYPDHPFVTQKGLYVSNNPEQMGTEFYSRPTIQGAVTENKVVTSVLTFSKTYLREFGLIFLGLIAFEFVTIFPEQLTTVGIDVNTATYVGATNIVMAGFTAFVRALVLSSVRAILKLVKTQK